MDNLIRLASYLPAEWNPNDFVLCGSASMTIRGLRDVNDLDVLIRPRLWGSVRELHRRGYWPGEARDTKDPQSNDGPRRDLLLTGEIDFFDEMPRIAAGVRREDVFTHAEFHQLAILPSGRTLRFACLRHVLAVKALAFRSKDYDDMVVLAERIRLEERNRPVAPPAPPGPAF